MTAERYTVVFTGFLSVKRPGEYLYLTMSKDPLGAEDGSMLCRGRPPCEGLGREIEFRQLPEACRCLILDAYKKLWNL